MVNSMIRPIANSIGIENHSLPPHMVSVQLTIFTPVGMAISIVDTVNTATRHRTEAAGEHVVDPHAPADEADRHAGEHHEAVAEQRLAAEHRQHLGDDAERREDEDVHLGVTEDPEQVLPQQRVGTGTDVEERRTELALEHQQEQRHRDDRDREQQQELHDERSSR